MASNTRNKGNNDKRGSQKQRSKSRNRTVSKNERRDKEIIDTARREDNSLHMSSGNDISWYSNFPQFAKDVATLPFSTVVGVTLDLNKEPTGNPNATTNIPGLMRIGFNPTVGVSKDNSSALNRSTLRFYSALRNKQKASAPYDPADAMLSMIALDSLYMFWAHIRRAYGVAQLFSPVNRYYPKALLQAMGISTSILDNLAEFRAYVNRFAINLGQFATPKFDMLLRHQWMCSGIYVDQPTTRAQTYMFVPDGFWMYDNTAPVGTQLTWAQWQDSKATNVTQHTLEDIQVFGNQLISALAGDEDIGRITGDIYAAFGPSNTFQAEETSDGYSVLPTYNELVLAQIENLKLSNGWAESYTPVITQDPSVNNGAIIFEPIVAGNYVLFTADNNYYDPRNSIKDILNAHMDSPDPAFVMEATRLIFVSKNQYDDKVPTTQRSQRVLTCGADIATNLRVWRANASNAAFKSLKINTNALLVADQTDMQIASVIAMMSPFDWHPILYVFDDSSEHKTVESEVIEGFFGDIDNVTILPEHQLDMMHEAAMLSLFDIPLNVIQA